MKNLRREYNSGKFDEADLNPDPFIQFENWFKDCTETNNSDCNSMVLSTISKNNRPSSRVVLLKGIDHGGLVFFTNYESRKAAELQNNPNACLLFYWIGLERQVRVEGTVEKITEAESEDYFNSRPLLSRISAIASAQSSIVENRQILEQRFEEIKSNPDQIKRPLHWGGYRLVPDYFEFWQGRENRLHDRFTYQISGKIWKIHRLAP